MEKLKLKVHSSGYDSTFQPLNMETAWLHVDLPCGNKPGADSTTVSSMSHNLLALKLMRARARQSSITIATLEM